jgi:D-hydroxyproline dehydrogenase subunit gamma
METTVNDEAVTLRVNGRTISVQHGTIVAAAVALAGISGFRCSVTKQPRGPLCGMGICMECRVTINGQAHCRSCQTLCEPDMEVRTESC